jgi:hypothetical protein
MKRKIAVFAALCLMVSVFAGCSTASPMDGMSSANGAGFVAETTAAAFAPDYASADMQLTAENAAAAGGEVTPLSSAEEISRKIIRNADITVNTLSADESFANVSAKITAMGGYVYTYSTRENELVHTYDVIYKIAPENLQAFCDWIAENENVSNANITADDITTSYYDSKTRLETARRSLEKYYEYLAAADTAEEMLMMQNQIDHITAQIESYEGQLRVWDTLVTESEIHVYINETTDPTRAELEEIRWDQLSWSNVGTLMSNGIRNVLYGLLAVFQWLLITIVTLSPILVIVALVIVLYKLYRKKHPKVKKAPVNKAANGTVYTPPPVSGEGGAAPSESNSDKS